MFVMLKKSLYQLLMLMLLTFKYQNMHLQSKYILYKINGMLKEYIDVLHISSLQLDKAMRDIIL